MAVLLLACPVAVSASVLSALNETHRACSPQALPLTETSALDHAAAGLAQGLTLHEVLGRLPARPDFAASVLLWGATSDASIRQAAGARFCRDLATAGLSEIGYRLAGERLYVIVTAPFHAPTGDSQRDAGREILAAVNLARRQGRRCGRFDFPPAAPVRWSDDLAAAALGHSEEMAVKDHLVHEGADGGSAADRVRGRHLSVRHVGENIASGVPTAREVIDGWLASDSHCATIMDSRFTAMGVAFALRPQSRGVIYWTQLFTEPRATPARPTSVATR